MIHQLNITHIIGLIYLAMIIITMVYLTTQNNYLEALNFFLAVIWPLTIMTSVLIKIFEEHDDLKRTIKIKRKSTFLDTTEGKNFLQANYSRDNTKRVRDSRAYKPKKGNVKVT